jgi:hypothetical protein
LILWMYSTHQCTVHTNVQYTPMYSIHQCVISEVWEIMAYAMWHGCNWVQAMCSCMELSPNGWCANKECDHISQCKILCSHSSINEDSDLLRCESVPLGDQFRMFWRHYDPSEHCKSLHNRNATNCTKLNYNLMDSKTQNSTNCMQVPQPWQ